MLTLYGTASCHLCEEAESLLRQLGLDWENVDISEDESLLQAYGMRIPVLSRQDGASLGWPFTADDIRIWLKG